MVRHATAVPHLDDTIVALSTPRGAGLRAIVRLSGPAAVRVVRTICPEFEPNLTRLRQIVSGGLNLPDVHSPLPADLFFFRGPKTYTGQDIIEIHTISSMPLVELLIATLLRAGARGAEPGEFTMRGFLAGKLDLTRAEAVHAVIEAAGADQLKLALGQLAGNVARPLDAVRDDLLSLLADVEAALDFSDEDLAFVEQPQLLARLAKGLAQVTLVAKQIKDRGTSGPAFRLVLAGPPNAGKSSLFNALVGRDAALVSPTAGTTRDYLEADLRIGDAVIRLIDTAGTGTPLGEIDAAAQSLGKERLADADLVVWCQDPTVGDGAPSPPGDLSSRGDLVVAGGGRGERVTISTKSDLGVVPHCDLAVSARTGEGIEELKTLLADRARIHSSNSLAPSLSRCRHHVDACLDHLRRAHRLALERDPAELLALELRLAIDELGAIVGAIYTDDLLDRIFSRFCIGK